MDARASAASLLEQEARALLTRLARLRPFSLQDTMVPAAALSPEALRAVERLLEDGRRTLRRRVRRYLDWLRGPGRSATPEEMQRQFVRVRLRFNNVITHFDLFADVITQRSEHDTGVWLAGLDVAAADALMISGRYFRPPPVVCYLDRGPGAAIRRARTRLPGGHDNPVAIIRVPRERMIGHGVASSLFHEVGHQAAALLDLVPSLQPELQRHSQHPGEGQPAWRLFERWISEVVADLWSISQLGVASTLGLIGVVSLPMPFVMRLNTDDPHPTPWLRVKISCAIGEALYPHSQWRHVARTWHSMYPPDELDQDRRDLYALAERTVPAFVDVMLAHRPKALRGRSLREILAIPDRVPQALEDRWRSWRGDVETMAASRPSLVFAAIGQARTAGWVSPEEESRLLGQLLREWALRSTLAVSSTGRYGPSRVPERPAVGRRAG